MGSVFYDVHLRRKTNTKLFLLYHIVHLFCYFKNYVKAAFPVPAKRIVDPKNKSVLDRRGRMIIKGRSLFSVLGWGGY